MLLKKGISSKIALLLSMILLLMCPNASVLAVDPDENEEVLFLVDKQTSYGWDSGINDFAWKDDSSGGVSVVNNWVECDIEASEDKDSLSCVLTRRICPLHGWKAAKSTGFPCGLSWRRRTMTQRRL